MEIKILWLTLLKSSKITETFINSTPFPAEMIIEQEFDRSRPGPYGTRRNDFYSIELLADSESSFRRVAVYRVAPEDVECGNGRITNTTVSTQYGFDPKTGDLVVASRSGGDYRQEGWLSNRIEMYEGSWNIPSRLRYGSLTAAKAVSSLLEAKLNERGLLTGERVKLRIIISAFEKILE